MEQKARHVEERRHPLHCGCRECERETELGWEDIGGGGLGLSG